MSKRELEPSTSFMPVGDVFGALLDQTITRVSIEPWSVRVLFETGELHVEGIWRLISPDGSVVDQNQELSARERFELWRIVKSIVLDFTFCDEPLPWFAMHLANHWSMEVRAGDGAFEDWSLTSSDVWIVCNGSKITAFRGDS